MFDGTVVSHDLALSETQMEACIGIVFSINPSKAGELAKAELGREPFGLVMALTDAVQSAPWGKCGIDENTPEMQQNNIQLMNADMRGLEHTLNVLDAHEEELENDYPAIYKTLRYGHTRATKNFAPSAKLTTGWFLPSVGQFMEFLENIGGLRISAGAIQSESSALAQSGKVILNRINEIFGYFSQEATFADPSYYWTSSEYDADNACTVFFHGDGYIDFNCTRKDSRMPNTRCILAF